MSLPKYKEIENVTTLNDLDQEIFVIQKDLFDLRLKRSTSQAIKPHLFKHAKRRLAQLKFKRSVLVKTEIK
jgi:large subunit ribosomal protein L29